MSYFQIDYEALFSRCSNVNPEDLIARINELLVEIWCAQYREMIPTLANILQFNVDGFEFLLDFSSGLIAQGTISDEHAVEDRVVVAFGFSQANSGQRDNTRQKGFLGPTSQVFRKGYDKGHFIGHSLGGGLDVNLFPQRRDINRGWSSRGKIFRAMETYCADNQGTFCFSRPIYNDRTWYPAEIEYGVLKQKGEWWIERFDN